MSWVKIDDGFPDHPKLHALGDDYERGLALHVRGLCYAARYLTDGFLPRRVFPDPLAERLCEVGLWEKAEGGWRIHDYLDYNPSKAERQRLLSARAEAGKHGAEKRWGREAAPERLNGWPPCGSGEVTIDGVTATLKAHVLRVFEERFGVPSEVDKSRLAGMMADGCPGGCAGDGVACHALAIRVVREKMGAKGGRPTGWPLAHHIMREDRPR